MNISVRRALLLFITPTILLTVLCAGIGFIVSQIVFQYQGGFISDFPITGWLQDVLGPGGLEGTCLGLSIGFIRVFINRKSEERPEDGSLKTWFKSNPAFATFITIVLLSFISFRSWWILSSGMYLGDHRNLVALLEKAENIEVYEGLPPPWNEVEYHLELKKPNREIHGFKFYSQPIRMTADDNGNFKQLFARRGSFCGHLLLKMCGGFHPDYCIEWRDGDELYQIQFCFGCSEIKAFGRGLFLHCDVPHWSKEKFAKLFEPYAKNRSKAASKNNNP